MQGAGALNEWITPSGEVWYGIDGHRVYEGVVYVKYDLRYETPEVIRATQAQEQVHRLREQEEDGAIHFLDSLAGEIVSPSDKRTA